jgi:signal transduction histidine kinase
MISLSVRDNGRGMAGEDKWSMEPHGGIGLTGMQERFELLGGQVEIRSEPGQGTEVIASVPLDTGGKEKVT